MAAEWSILNPAHVASAVVEDFAWGPRWSSSFRREGIFRLMWLGTRIGLGWQRIDDGAVDGAARLGVRPMLASRAALALSTLSLDSAISFGRGG